MAYLALLFLDLASLPVAKGEDDALYRQAMIDHHLSGPITRRGLHRRCYVVAKGGSDIDPGLTYAFITHNPMPMETDPQALFSEIGRYRDRAYLQINASDATFCSLYRRVGASYRLLREVRLPR
jgi:hypothetical protein